MKLLWQARMAARAAKKQPALFLTSALILGAAIGVNTALFSLLHAVLLRPVPGVERSGELLRIRRSLKGQTQNNQSYPDFLDIRGQSRTLGGLAAERLIPMRLAGPPAEVLTAAIVSANYFQVLGVRPVLGRLFEEPDEWTAHPVAILSHSEWQRRFGGDPAVLGKTMVLNAHPYTIVGVASALFRGIEFGESTALWVPVSMASRALTRPPGYNWLGERRAGWLTYYARPKPGMGFETVNSDLAEIGRRLAALYPDSNAGRGFVAIQSLTMSPGQQSQMRVLFGLLSAAATLVLLIACGNIGNLLLARAAAQAREIAVRMALGARRMDLLRQPLAEAALIGAAGGLLGVLVAPWMLPLLRKTIPAVTSADVLDSRVLAFSLGVTLLAVALFGLAPAWFAIRSDLAVAGLNREFGAAGRARGRMMRVWVVAQVALSLALVVNGSLVLGSMRKILAIDPGYRPEVLITSMDLSLASFTAGRGTEFFRSLQERVSGIPGVRSATIAKSSPAVDWSDRFELKTASGAALTADRNIVAPEYFRTLGIPLLAGRDFSASDREGAPQVAIVSKTLAEKLAPGANAVGSRVFDGGQAFEIVGIAADSRYRTVLEAPPALLYRPLFQQYDSIGRLMVSVQGDPDRFKETLRKVVEQANPELPVRSVATLQEQIDASLWQRSAAASLLSLFGGLAIALACAGIYGVVSYATAQATRDIAIRMALGAGRSGVLIGIQVRTIKMVAVGIALGLPLAAWAKPSLASMLYGIGGAEPLAFAGVSCLFVLVALAAAAVPARRAATVDPALALRAE
jgi:predicted permease